MLLKQAERAIEDGRRRIGICPAKAHGLKSKFITSAALLAAALRCIPGSFAQSSAMFRGDIARTGVYQSAAPQNISHIAWEFKTGERVLSSPVVAEGTVYVGSNDHLVHAIDAKSGREIWKFQTDANVNGSPACANGMVYILSLDGNAYALEARTGKLLWKFQTGGESRLNLAGIYGLLPSREVVPDAWDFLLSSPAVDGGVVYFGSGDHHVYALDAQIGKLRWKFEAGDVVHSSPAIANGILYVGCWDGGLYALNAKTGELAWKFTTGSDATHFMQGIPGSPAVADGIVVFGSRDNNIYALDAALGKEIWRQGNSCSWVIASPAIENGVVYITTSDTMKLRALALKTGTQLFDLTFKAYSFSSPAVASGHAYFGTFDGAVYDADLVGRQMRGEFRVQASKLHKDLLTADGHLNTDAIFGPPGPDGKSNNTIDATIVGIDRLLQLGSILSSPAVVDGIVYVASTDGSVYALN